MFTVDEEKIVGALKNSRSPSTDQLREILQKAKELKGISQEEILSLLKTTDHEMVQEIHQTASFIKNEIYGKRLVLFAPLYVSNYCNNECSYCAFRTTNNELDRKALTKIELKTEVTNLIKSGHRRLLLVAGEDYRAQSFERTLESIDEIYSVSTSLGGIRRINVNVAPTSVSNFKRLNEKKIGTYQLFQESYHQKTYESVHLSGPKSNFNYRLTVMDRALEGGIKDIGVGILFGLYDYQFEIMALMEHIKHLEKNFNIGPHTISVPRIEPARNSPFAKNPPYVVSDDEFLKIISILRIAVPYTGIILSTRETPMIRKKAFDLGVSQISAGSKTNPGDAKNGEQFSLGDHRSLLEVVKDIVDSGYIPSFCTGCYRNHRIGNDFMDLAKVGLIKNHCLPNGLFSFLEYINDFGDGELKKNGVNLIEAIRSTEIPNEKLMISVTKKLNEINNGKRDIYF